MDIGGLRVPDAGPVFLATLLVHVASAVTCGIAGALAATARKQPGRHTRSGVVYLYGMAVVYVTATVLAVQRWRQDWHLFLIATVAFGLAIAGWWAHRRHRPLWMIQHGWAMAGSYVGLFTGFYVDNGPHLPLWDRLPHLLYWLVPAAVGTPLTVLALRRNGAAGRAQAGLLPGSPASTHK